MIFGNDRYLKQQERKENLVNYIRQDQSDREKIKFLTNTSGKKSTNNKYSDRFKKLSEQKMEDRKNKLRRLLMREDEMYKNELCGKFIVNKEDKIEQMRQEYEILRQQNEEEKSKLVDQMRDLQFRNNTDEIRNINQKAYEMKTQIEREIQMIEKHKRLEKEYERDMILAEIEKKDIEEKMQKEQQKQEEHLQLILERNEALQQQIEDIHKKRKQQLNELEEEKKELKKIWAKNRKEELEKNKRQAELNRKIADEVKRHNQLQKMEKEEQIRQVKEEDKVMIERIIKREKELDILEQKQKKIYQQKIKEFFASVQKRNNLEIDRQRKIDELIKQELERQWQKKLQQWKKEEEARVKLMKHVYEHRYDQIMQKKALKQEEEELKQQEKEILQEKQKIWQEEEEQYFLGELQKIQNYRGEIADQIREKYMLQKQEIEKELERERLNRLKQLQLEKRIQEEREKGELLLQKMKKLRDAIY